MNHGIKGRKFNRTSSHRLSMLNNMSVSLIMHEQIYTTFHKAKDLRSYIEKLISKSKVNNIVFRRKILSKIKDKIATKKLFEVLGVRYNNRPGGYTRIVKSGFRYGDMAHMVYIELIDRDINSKGYISSINISKKE